MKLTTILFILGVAGCGKKAHETPAPSSKPQAREQATPQRTGSPAPTGSCYDDCIAKGTNADDCGVECFQGNHPGDEGAQATKLPKPVDIDHLHPGSKYWALYAYGGDDPKEIEATTIRLLDRGLRDGHDFGRISYVILVGGEEALGVSLSSDGIVLVFKTEKEARAFADDLRTYTGIAHVTAGAPD